jgi:hypothetical protein
MSAARSYLRIPEEYARYLGGLRWSADGDAIEDARGITFAFRQQIAHFLEGFTSIAAPVHFAFVLHLMHLVSQVKDERPRRVQLLPKLFVDLHRPLRNAGVLCAGLCEDVPRAAGLVDIRAVLDDLRHEPAFDGPAEAPPLGPETFEEIVLRELRDYELAELASWLRFGREPVAEAADKVAEELSAARPRSLAEVFGALAQRQRLAGAAPFLPQMVSALSLPPRRLAERELPMGGYADVTTRGAPEQILPSQFAVDELEFVRRFAENELLYFRREEPHARTREELVLVVDQGVRTWGDVRLLLVAAVHAFAKLAERKKVAFRVAATSAAGPPLDPPTADEKAVAELLEASDLSADPGRALEGVLEEKAAGPRDVVLLTHPRNLTEPDVAAAARCVTPGTRLFALTADEHGGCALAEVRHGAPVSVTRFCVDLTPKRLPTVARPPAEAPAGPWTGAGEPIGFPFHFGVSRRGGKFLFDFDADGEWVLIATHNGMLSLSRTDGTRHELLPRGFADGKVLKEVGGVIGVAGGFAVVGMVDKDLITVHYDLASRTARLHRLGEVRVPFPYWLHYFRDLHAVVARYDQTFPAYAVDLATGDTEVSFGAEAGSPRNRAARACLAVAPLGHPPHQLRIFTGRSAEDRRQPHVLFLADSGSIHPSVGGRAWSAFVPQADGKPILQGATLHQACCVGPVLAVSSSGGRWGRTEPVLRLFRAPDGATIREYVHKKPAWAFTLSRDGRKLVRQVGDCRLEMSEIEGGQPVRLPRQGGYHQHVDVELCETLLVIRTGSALYLIGWGDGPLRVTRLGMASVRRRHGSPASMAGAMPGIVARADAVPSFARYDPSRFTAGIHGRLIVVVDSFGQVAVLDRFEKLVCMFSAFVGLEAWMPPDVRWPQQGSAAEAIGAALADAWERGGSAAR